jgi:polyhydroxyalkanoate synthesis regulator phasin
LAFQVRNRDFFPCLLAFEKTILGASLKELVDQDQTVSKQVVESREDQKGYVIETTAEARGTAGQKEGRRVRNVLDDLSIQKGKPQARREEVSAGAMRRLQG